MADSDDRVPTGDGAEHTGLPRSRRDLILAGVAGAVGATVGAGLIPSPAGAVAGDTVHIDQTTTGSGGTTALLSTTLQTALHDAGGQVFDVRAFGAAGDGSTDDTTAIAAAQTAAGSGCVYFPPGTYVVSGLSITHANQTFKLESGATVILKSGLSSPVAVITVTAAGVAILGPGVVDGNASNETSANGFDGVKFAAGGDDGLIEGVTVQNAAWVGIRADAANRTRIALNNVVNCLHAGISSNTTSASFDGPLILGNTVSSTGSITTAGINVQGSSAAVMVNYPRVIGNQVVVASGIAVQVVFCQYAKIADNTASGPRQVISVGGGAHNVISGNTALPSGPGAGIEFGCNDSVCVNNVVNHSGTGCGITADNIAGTRVVISSNKVTGAQTQGIKVGSYDHVTVTGNVIQQGNLSTPAVYGVIEVSPTGVGLVLVGDNVCDGAGWFDFGIWVMNLVTGQVQLSIHDNAVSGAKIAAFRFSGSGSPTDVLVHDNTIASGISLYTLDAGLTPGGNFRLHDNIVVGATNAGLAGFSLPASGTPYVNNSLFTEIVYLQGGVLAGAGTANGVVKDNHVLVQSDLRITFPMGIMLQPGEAITVYYSTAPSAWRDIKS